MFDICFVISLLPEYCYQRCCLFVWLVGWSLWKVLKFPFSKTVLVVDTLISRSRRSISPRVAFEFVAFEFDQIDGNKSEIIEIITNV